MIAENRFSDIVASRFDIGIRLGDDVAKDMIAVRVSDDLVMQTAARQGKGLVWLPQDVLAAAVQHGELVSVLDDWAIRYSGYYLYYPSRRADSPLFQALVQALRWRG
ncbi:LysR substrate-binding domain-containing protein [Pasteurella testudinis]|uniref:LysR substrate-binding domain-containing protein n=1 Tax=Pasteurella testudinis TaxID=761 RepID=UPI0040599722